MDAREYLEKHGQAQRKADKLKEKYEELRAAYDAIGGTDYTSVRHAGINKPTERKIEKAQAALEKWRRAQLDALEIRQNVYALIMALSCHEADILIERYINLQTWDQIEQATQYSRTAVFKIHRQALQHIQDNIDSGYLDEINANLDAYIKKRINIYSAL